MSINLHRLSLSECDFNQDGTDQYLNPDGTRTVLPEDGSAIDLGGGLFLTAAHLFNATLIVPPKSDPTLLRAFGQTLDGTNIDHVYTDPGYNSAQFYSQIQVSRNYSYPGHDLALVEAPASSSSSPAV